MNETKAKVAWNILWNEYRGDKKVKTIKLQSLRRDFENLKMKDGEMLQAYFTRLMEIVNQMKIYGEDMSSMKIVEKILITLTSTFNPIVAVIENMKDLETLSVEELMGSLKAFEQRLSKQNEKPLESAFQSKLNVGSSKTQGSPSTFDRSKGGKGKGKFDYARGGGKSNFQRNNFERRDNEDDTQQRCKICKRSSHVEKDCWFRGKPQCHNCKKFGHVKKDCRLPISQQANFSEKKEVEGNLLYACQNALEKNDDVWFVDSGCSNHMTGDESIFVKLDNSSNSQVKMGNGAVVQAKGKGTIAVETKKGTRYISDVLLVPDLEQNLLSVGQMIEHGYVVHFENDSCMIYEKGGSKQVIANIKMVKNRSFPLTLNYSRNVALKMNVVDESWIWHKRMGHLNFQILKYLKEKGMVYGLPNIQEVNQVCEGCALGKQHREAFPKDKAWRAKAPLELVHTDVCGPMDTTTHGGNKYFLTFIDDFSRMTWVYFMREKSEVFNIFKKFQTLVERQSGHLMKKLRSDRGGEYTSNEFIKFCEDIGMERQLTVRYTPQQNGVAERKNRTIEEMANAMLLEKGLPKIFWGEAVNTAVYLLNRCPTKALANKTPFEVWSKRKPSVNHLKVFGCICYSHVPKELRHKLDQVSENVSLWDIALNQKAIDFII